MRARILDVSHHQNPRVDWKRAQVEDGISGAIIRYAHGLAIDETFNPNFEDALAAGIKIGSYFFLHGDRNVDEQVQLYVSSPYSKFDLPMGVDVEHNPYSSKQVNEGMVRRFCEELERITGKLPSIYTSAIQWHTLVGRGRTWASKYPLHVAHYNESIQAPDLPDAWTNWYLWQYKVGKLNSYPYQVDQNYFNGTVTDLCCEYPSNSFRLAWPVDSEVVTQEFGNNPTYYGPLIGANHLGHEGVDFRAPTGSNIYACADGRVVKAYNSGGSYGILIEIDHQNGYRTLYAHLQQALVSAGNQVVKGQLIAKADNTGNSSGSHLHLNLYKKGVSATGQTAYPKDLLNPSLYLDKPDTAKYVPIRSINTITLNIRALPTTASQDIGDIPPFSTLEGVPTTETWWKVNYNGIEGWALSEYLEMIVDEPTHSLRCTAQPYLNIRAGQGTTFTDIGDIYYGEIVQGWAVSGATWWKVVKGSITGYALAQYLEIV